MYATSLTAYAVTNLRTLSSSTPSLHTLDIDIERLLAQIQLLDEGLEVRL
jgi:hypothetical protein